MRLLSLPLLAFLLATPFPAAAGGKQKVAFSIDITGSWRTERFPTNPPDIDYTFRASGAIKDSGVAFGAPWGFDLWGQDAEYAVLLDVVVSDPWTGSGTGTFEIWRPTDDAWPGDLVGSGTVTFETGGNGWTHHQRWQLDGTLSGG